MPLDLKDPPHSFSSINDSLHSYRLELGEVKIHLRKFDSALENLQLARTLSDRKQLRNGHRLFPLKLIVQLLKMLQKHKSNTTIAFSTYDDAKNLLSKCINFVVNAVPEDIESRLAHHPDLTPEHLENFIEAVNISIDICDKKTAQTLLQTATQLEEARHDYGAVPKHFQSELKMLSEKTNSLRCSTFDEILQYISGFLDWVRCYGN